jgi:type IV pilus biogenesis protein CpaD/CtpE
MSKLIRADRIAAAAALAALTLACASQALAQGDDQPDPLAVPPPTHYVMPGVTLRVTPSQVRAGTSAQITFRVVQTRRAMKRGTVQLTLPKLWRERPAAAAPTYAAVPLTGTGSSGRVRVRRIGQVVRFSFTNGRRNDVGTYAVTDRTLPGGTYHAPFKLSADGYQAATGNLSVVVLPFPRMIPLAPAQPSA